MLSPTRIPPTPKKTPKFQNPAPATKSSGYRRTVRHNRAINQIAVPMPAMDAQPYTITFIWAGRTRPHVRKLMSESKSGVCSLNETKPASNVPRISQATAEV